MSTPGRTIRITGEPQRRQAHDIIGRIVTGGDRLWEVVIRPVVARRKADQNAKFHAMIGDIHGQAFRGYELKCLKAVLVQQFADEKAEMAEPLKHPGATAWDWKRKQPVTVRPSTTDFSVSEAAEFIEWLYAEGTALDIQWSEKALAAYEEYREVAA